MFMRSTGLGRTLLTGRVSNIFATTIVPSTLEEPQGGVTEPVRMMMMEIVNPVHWTVRAFLDPSDLRKIVKVVVTNPSLILKGIKFFFSKDPDYGELAKAEASAPKAAPGSVPKGPGGVPSAAPKGPGAIPSRA
ncbi:MAG: hypothetical protein NT010_07650 [Proteobacteria bacterium]|nr:hypothetical protein [Pseudomonadota bacterium]